MRRARTIIAFILLAFGLAGCYLLNPPYALNNPHDPGNAWQPAEAYGRLLGSDRNGIPGACVLAASSDGSFVVSGSMSGSLLWIIQTSNNSIKTISPGWWYVNDICMDRAGRFVYASDWGHWLSQLDITNSTVKTISSIPDSDTRYFRYIALDGQDNLYVQIMDQSGNVTINRMNTAGGVLGTLTSPYFTSNDIRGMAVGSELYLSLDGSINGVVAFDKSTGATVSEIYFDGFDYKNVSLAGGAPVPGTRNPGAIAFNSAQGRLVVDFGGDPMLASVFDPHDFVAPLLFQHGSRADFSLGYANGLAVDDAGRVYASDLAFNFIQELSSGNTVYSQAPQTGDFLYCRDLSVAPNNAIYLVDSMLCSLSSFNPAGGSFQILVWPGMEQGELNSPYHVTADATRIFCTQSGNSSVILHFDAGGTFIDQGSAPGGIDRMAVMSDGRLLLWLNINQSGWGFYTEDSSWNQTGPFLRSAPFSQAYDISLSLFPDGRMYCAVWGGDFASIGILADDLSAYTEVWNSSGAAAFLKSPQDWQRYSVSGIAPGSGGDIWAHFAFLCALTRFDAGGHVIASYSLWDGSPGEKSRPFEIAAFSQDQNGGWYWPSGFAGPVENRVDHSLYIFDNDLHQIRRIVPAQAQP
jgi:hypothetical protein